MRQRAVSTSLLVVLMVGMLGTVAWGAGAMATAQPTKPEPVMGNAGLIIADADLPQLQHDALRGSPDAAHRLFLFFEAVKIDLPEAMYWASIAAENGHPGGQYTYGYLLLHEPHLAAIHITSPEHKARARERAIFWLEKAAAQGIELAEKVLRRLAQ